MSTAQPAIYRKPAVAHNHVHWLLSGLLALALVPTFRFSHLPLRVDAEGLATAYWLGNGIRAIAIAVLLLIAALPWRQTLGVFLSHCRISPLTVLPLTIVALGAFRYSGFWLGFSVTLTAVAISELLQRRSDRIPSALVDILFPALYLFLGVVMLWAFNHAIAGIRFAGTYDLLLNRVDSILFQITVPELSNAAALHLPSWVFNVSEMVYYSLFSQIGAALMILALLEGRKRALRYVGTIMVSYCIAIVIFLLCPTMGPFSLRTSKEVFPQGIGTYGLQQKIVSKAQHLQAHDFNPNMARVDITSYFIGFPCLHVALPIIALWFLWKWRAMALTLLAWDILFVPAIVLLQWHYLFDLLGGICVAAIAIWLQARDCLPRRALAAEAAK